MRDSSTADYAINLAIASKPQAVVTTDAYIPALYTSLCHLVRILGNYPQFPSERFVRLHNSAVATWETYVMYPVSSLTR